MITENQVKKYINNLEVLIENTKKLKKQEIIDEIVKLYNQVKNDFLNIDNDIQENQENEFLEELNFYKEKLQSLINKQNEEIASSRYSEKPVKVDLRRYTELIVSKLNILFRQREIVSQSKSETLCTNVVYLENKYRLFIALIEWINDNGISVLIDRMLFCSFLNISTEAYDNFLNSNDETIQTIFASIENMYISQKLNASEIGTRNSSAIRTNLSYSKVGAGLTPKDNGNDISNLNKVLTVSEIIRKAQALGYDPKAVEVENKEK